MKRSRRIICIALCFAMLAGYLPAPVHAEDLSRQGLCDHHPEHIDCSYAPAVDAMECGHQHDGTCFVQEENCIHTHDGCGAEEFPCEHICSENTGCITVTLNCQHEHDSECCYAEARDVMACDYVCTECSTQEEDVPCDGTLACLADEYKDDCEKKTADDIAAEQEAAQKAAEEQAAMDQAAADASETVSGTCGDNLTWTLDDAGTLTISGTGPMPDFEDAYEQPWYYHASSIQKVVIQDGVTEIGNYAFCLCRNITEISVPDSVTAFGSRTFSGCNSLTSIEIPAAQQRIWSFMFSGCSSLTSITVPDGVTSIEDNAFAGAGLTSLVIPDSVMTIGNRAFDGCKALEEVVIGKNVRSLYERAFAYCSSLTAVRFTGSAPGAGANNVFAFSPVTAYYPGTNSSWTEQARQSISYNATWVPYDPCEKGHNYDADGKCDVCGKVEPFAYGQCGDTLLWEYDGTGSLTITGTGEMYNFSSVETPWEVYEDEITTVVVNEGVTSIGYGAFMSCSKLNTVTLPDTLIRVAAHSFSACPALEQIQLPDSLEEIDSYAFSRTGLKSLHLGRALQQIGDGNPFANNSSLQQITIAEDNLYFAMKDNVLFTKEMTRLICYPCGLNQECYTVPDGVTSIGDSAFSENNHIKVVNLPDTLEILEGYAFVFCNSLCQLEIPSGLQKIEDMALNSTALEQIVIPASVEFIGHLALGHLDALQSITFKGDAPEIHSGAFGNENFYTEVTAYYHSDNPTWNEDTLQNYGGKITWVPVYEKYSVMLDPLGGTIYDWDITEYVPGTAVQLPTNVIRSGYIFQGWYEGDLLVTEIPADAIGDKEYTARWQEKATVEFDTTTQRYAYDGSGKEFVLKDINGNILQSFNSQSNEQWVIPCSFEKIKPFGNQEHPEVAGASSFHQGIDLAAPEGTPIYATRSGQVTSATYGSAAGYHVKINHPDGFSSIYMHMTHYVVSAGQQVVAGQLIGYVGQTGVTVEPHLHFGIQHNGAYVDPESYINLNTASEAFCIDYTYSGMQLNENGLPYESGSYSVRITRPETATCKAVDFVIKPAIIIVPASGKCGNNLIWEFDKDTGTLTISGSGWMYDFSPDNPAPWNVYAESIQELNISNLNTSISAYAFAECHALTSVTIPDSVYGIRDAAFSGCTSLKAITFDGDSPSIAENAFAGVTVTAYYPAGWNWYEDDFADYGGKITWVETGVEAKKLTVPLPKTMAPGMKIQNYVSVRPWNATGEYAVSVSNPDVLEFVSIENDYIEICALKAGTATVTVKELRSGLEYSGEITVVEPQVISAPCSMDLRVPEGDSLQYLSFTPDVSGAYRFWSANIEHMTLSNGGYGDGISVLECSEWVEAKHYTDAEGTAFVVNMNAGKTYTIIVPFYLSAYEQTAAFTAEKVDDEAGTALHFYQDQQEITFMPGENSWHTIHVNYEGTEPLTWISSNPAVVEITDMSTEHHYCGFRIHNEGAAVVTVSNGVLSDSITIVTKEVEFVELYLPKTVTAETDYLDRAFGFVAPEAGRYAFSVSSENAIPSINFHSLPSDANIMYSYGENSCTGFRTMEAGESCQFYVWGDLPSCTARVSKAAAKPLSMKVVTTNQYSDQISFSVNFAPGNACERIIKWEIDNREIASEFSNPDRVFSSMYNEMVYEIFNEGTLTVTAISESGLRANLTVEVQPDTCRNGHNYGDWVPVLDKDGLQTGRERRTCVQCTLYQERKTPPLNEAVENRLVLDVAAVAGQGIVWIDGLEYTLHRNGDKCYVDLPDGNAHTMVTYTYHVGNAEQIHTQYPVTMKVWKLNRNENGSYSAIRVEELDNILQYSGMSIRVTGKKGIRMITSIEKAKKSALVSDGLAGYTLKEYGTAIAWASALSDDNPLVLGKSYVKSNYAYKKGVADPIFQYTDDLMQYTNVLVNFSNDQCKNDIAMRPYMILEDESGQQITIYGGIVYRSIGYIAYQNRNVFEPETEEYKYIWDIIRYVYGDIYDDEFIHAWTPTIK